MLLFQKRFDTELIHSYNFFLLLSIGENSCPFFYERLVFPFYTVHTGIPAYFFYRYTGLFINIVLF